MPRSTRNGETTLELDAFLVFGNSNCACSRTCVDRGCVGTFSLCTSRFLPVRRGERLCENADESTKQVRLVFQASASDIFLLQQVSTNHLTSTGQWYFSHGKSDPLFFYVRFLVLSR